MGNNMLPMIFKTADYLPDLFKISYYSGFPNNKTPQNITQVIGKKVQIDVLTQISNMLLGYGVVNQSIAIDGASQNISKIPFIYEKQIALLRKQIAEEVSTLRSFYSGIRMVVA
jgi:C1A family cysteine protease